MCMRILRLGITRFRVSIKRSNAHIYILYFIHVIYTFMLHTHINILPHYAVIGLQNIFHNIHSQSLTGTVRMRCVCFKFMVWYIFKYILSSMYLIFIQFSQLPFMQYIGLCVFSLPISLLLIMRMRVLYLFIIVKSEFIGHCRVRVRAWNKDMRCMSLYVIFVFNACVYHRAAMECAVRIPNTKHSSYEIVMSIRHMLTTTDVSSCKVSSARLSIRYRWMRSTDAGSSSSIQLKLQLYLNLHISVSIEFNH